MVLVMQSEKRGVKIDPTLGLQELSVLYEIAHCMHQGRSQRGARGGGPALLIKSWPPWLARRYIESFQIRNFPIKIH